MTCKLNSLFSIGEDFDDEDLLETDWTVGPSCSTALGAAAVSPGALRAPSASCREATYDSLEPNEQKSATLCDITAWHCGTAAAGQNVSQSLRQLSSSSAQPAPLRNTPPDLAPQHRANDAERRPKPFQAPDDFDDWDVDLADLEECDRQMGRSLQPPAPGPPVPASTAKTLRPSSHGGIQTRPGQNSREWSAARKPPGLSGCNTPAPAVSTPVRSSLPRPALMAAASPLAPHVVQARSPIPRPVSRPQQPQRHWVTPGPSNQTRSVFGTTSPVPSAPSIDPNPLHTPVLTNRLVQLVSASSKRPSKRPRLDGHRPRTRRFPGPAGMLPEQPQLDMVDKVVVSVPLIPAHGAVARLSTQASSSQADEDDFSGGAWAAMKAEMGLDERNPSCFLHSCSVVMVLRKAALKQLPKNKVPNMAVLLRSLVHTHADAKAVFKDPTGEIQGTVHRRLLVDREEELKVGAVLLLKQVGVFSPSHRNHYLNVTVNNLLRVYSPYGQCLSSTPLPPLVMEPMLLSPVPRCSVSREPVSRMQLVFDEDDDVVQETEAAATADPQTSRGTEEHPSGTTAAVVEEGPGLPDAPWGVEDDLDELLGQLPDDSYSL